MFLEHVMKDEREEVDKQFKYAVENKTNWDFQCRIKRCDNEIRWIWACGQHHLDNHNNIYRMAGIIQDITERKKHEEELVKAKDIAVANEVQFRLLLENAPVAIFIQVEQLFGYLNKAALNLYGAQTLEELMGTPVIDRIHPDFKGLVNERIKLILEKDIQVEKKDYKHVALDGSDIDVEVSAVPIKFNHKKGALVFVNDITQRKKTQLLLQEKNNEIESQNEEYKQINEELFRAKEKAEESDRLKTAFLQNMSHEIRTPMNAIMGFSDLMKSNLDNKEKLKYFSHIINQRSNDLLNIVNDMLDIARIESGQLPANMEECNVYAMFEELTSFFSEYQQRIDKMHISFTTRVQGNLQEISIITDKVKLKQIFINLLTNAFKFTEEGNIEAGCKLDTGQNMLFYVKDTGIGIPLEKQNIIFERFTQLDQTPKKNVGGIGLGLSIVKGLVDILNGKMFLKSEPGIGSIFSFSIPFKQVQPENKHNHESMTNPLNRLLCKTILLVEDDLYNAEYIQEVLTITGARVLLAETGQQAVHLSLSEPVDLVLMDIRLPDINGYEATRKIHEHKPDLKIIAQTAYASNEEEEKALNAGCNDYISKPTSKNVLLSIVEKYLG
jgi:PAS domain S-box-containing protein